MKKLSLLILIIAGIVISVQGQETLTLGKEKNKGELIFPRQFEEGPDGNIYVYDLADAFIKVYSLEGKFLRTIGGEGQGPGEIQRKDGLTFGFTPEKKLFFSEFFGGHRWITLMELSGEFSRVIKYEIKERSGLGNIFSLPGGGFLADFAFVGIPEKKKDYFLQNFPQKLFVLDKKGRIVSKILEVKYFTSISYLSGGADTNLPFVPIFTWAPFEENKVIFSDGLSTKLKVYDFNGNLVNEIDTLLPEPEKVTNKDLEKWRKRRKENVRDKSWYNKFGSVIEKYKKSIYDKKPNISRISVTPAENIFLSGRNESNLKSIDYWLCEKNGKALGNISTSAINAKITKSFVIFALFDEDINQTILILKRTGDESVDILKLKKF